MSLHLTKSSGSSTKLVIAFQAEGAQLNLGGILSWNRLSNLKQAKQLETDQTTSFQMLDPVVYPQTLYITSTVYTQLLNKLRKKLLLVDIIVILRLHFRTSYFKQELINNISSWHDSYAIPDSYLRTFYIKLAARVRLYSVQASSLWVVRSCLAFTRRFHTKYRSLSRHMKLIQMLCVDK